MSTKKTMVLAVLFFAQSAVAGITEQLQAYYQETSHKCGTNLMMRALMDWNTLPADLKKQITIQSAFVPSRTDTMFSPSGRFLLHWDVAGTHAVPSEDISGNGIPDYIDSAAVILDHVWEREVFELGFQPPLNAAGLTDSAYNVYFTDMSNYGTTTFGTFGDDIPSIPGTQFTSYLELENDYSESIFFTQGLDGLRVTAAHEFNHACQFGYNVWFSQGVPTDFFFYEMTATWLEDAVYPQINDYYAYLNYFFDFYSGMSFNSFQSLFPYGNTLFVHMLAQKYGELFISPIWSRIKTVPAMQAIKSNLQQPPANTDWLHTLNEYAAWIYFTGSRSIPGQYFTDASIYPELNVRFTDQLEASPELLIQRTQDGNSNRFFKITGINNTAYNLLPMGTNAGLRLMKPGQSSTFMETNSLIELAAFTSDSLIIVVTNAADASGDISLAFSLASGIVLADVYPNPAIEAEGHNKITFRNLKADSEILILTTSGKRVTILKNRNNGFVDWNLQNDNGEAVGSGIYLYLIKGSDGQASGKISLLR